MSAGTSVAVSSWLSAGSPFVAGHLVPLELGNPKPFGNAPFTGRNEQGFLYAHRSRIAVIKLRLICSCTMIRALIQTLKCDLGSSVVLSILSWVPQHGPRGFLDMEGYY